MTKAQLSSDLDLVKEIEQLKIKQKLLLKALKEKEQEETQEKILESMSAQIQFLVEIFKEVNSNDGKDIEEENKNQTEQISKKLDSMKTALFVRMDLLEKKIDSISIQSQETIIDEVPRDPETITEQEVQEVLGEKEIVEEKASEISNTQNLPNEIPKPDFEVKEEPKKKGWFSK